MYSVYFNNLNSYNDLGLYIESRPNLPIAEEQINSISIEGRNGTLTEKYGTYNDIEINIKFVLINDTNYCDQVRNIKAWLQNIQDNKLVLSDDTNYFYLVTYIKFDKNILRESELEMVGSFTATFICKPFAYSFEGLNKITITQETNIINEGTVIAYPMMKVYGSGDITLTINNKNIILSGIINNITLDSIIMEAYDDNIENVNNKMNGEFPVLDIGENNISWVGTISKIEIIPNWCYL
jgi:predicted phage tail component-like protein